MGTAGKLWMVLLVVAVAFLVGTYFATNLCNNNFSTPILFIIPLVAVVSLFLVRVKIMAGSWLAP